MFACRPTIYDDSSDEVNAVLSDAKMFMCFLSIWNFQIQMLKFEWSNDWITSCEFSGNYVYWPRSVPFLFHVFRFVCVTDQRSLEWTEVDTLEQVPPQTKLQHEKKEIHVVKWIPVTNEIKQN